MVYDNIEWENAYYKKISSGEWLIKLAVNRNGRWLQESFTTNDSQAIDAWDEETDNYPETGRIYLVEQYLDEEFDED